ncbi:hypothetical protein B0H12DRAFT_1077775 [Mycena haematopus]|nr:hypothetical protein B0H12DRAFT_1077775 [Mycena haematopus]
MPVVQLQPDGNIGGCRWCRRAIARMTTKSTKPLESTMEKEYEQKLAREVEQELLPWRLHPIYDVPLCGSECPRCSQYIRHLSQAMTGRVDDSSDDSDSDESNATEDSRSKVPSEGSGDAEEEDGEPHPAVFGRAQESIANLMTKIFEIEKEHEEVEAKARVVEQEIRATHALVEELQAKLLRLDSGRQRKRPFPPSPATEAYLPPTEIDVHDIDRLVTRTTHSSAKDAITGPEPTLEEKLAKELHKELQSQFLRIQRPGSTDPPEQLARWIQSHKSHQIRGIPSYAPGYVIDLRDVRGHQALMTLAPLGIGRRSRATRQQFRICFLAMLRILIIPGAYAAILQRISAPIRNVPLTKLAFGSASDQLNEDTLARNLAANGLTLPIADDCWQFCFKFVEAELNSSASGYDKKELEDMIARAQATVAMVGQPPGIRPAIEDAFPSTR